ncbi:beta-glucoside-specific PTS transporter subunit IIABC [Fusibacter bizertensis]
MNYKQLSKLIVEAIGGAENINEIWHCMTRVRFSAVENEKVDIKKLESLEGVLGVRLQNGQFQIVIGNEVSKLFVEIEKLVETDKNSKSTKKVGNIFSQVVDVLSGLFTPILPAIVGTGLMKAFLAIVVLMNAKAPESGVYKTFEIIADAAFYFLPFLLAVSAAKRFKVHESLAMVVAGTLLYPTILNNAGGEALSFLGLNVPMLNYSSSVIPIILGVLLLSYVDRMFKKIIPEMFNFVFIPMLTLGVTLPITLIALAPLGNYASVYFANGINWLFLNMAPVAGLIYTGLMPLIVMVGMHYAFFPAAIQSITTLGYDTVLLPANLIHNSAQAGAAFAVGVKLKDKKMKSVAFSTGVSAIFGITEPAMYGVNLKYKKPFYAVMISAGLVGSVAVTLGLKCFTFATPGILSIPGYATPDGATFNLILAVAAYVASFVLAFVITLIWKFDIGEVENDKPQTIVSSPVDGKLIPLSAVKDSTFSDGIVGKGIAIYPEDDTFYAPFDGEVMMIFKTKHAIALKSTLGVELLIHVGLETVNLEGRPFEVLVNNGEFVSKGQPLLKIDREMILAENYDLTTPIVITNSDMFEDLVFENKEGSIAQGQAMFSVQNKS